MHTQYADIWDIIRVARRTRVGKKPKTIIAGFLLFAFWAFWWLFVTDMAFSPNQWGSWIVSINDIYDRFLAYFSM